MNTAKPTGITTKALTFGFTFLAILSTLGFTACGKKNNGGPALQNPGPIGLANQCTGGWCMGAASGQTLGRPVGRVYYDDNLDDDSQPYHNQVNQNQMNQNPNTPNNQNNQQVYYNGGRLMEITATINMWQTAQNTNMWGNAQNFNPYQRFGNSLSGQQLMYVYVGGVQISGNVQVFQQPVGCHFTAGNYTLQGNGVIGMDNTWLQPDAVLTATNGTNQFRLVIDAMQVQTTQAITNNNQTYDAVLKGFVFIPECNDAKFRVE